MTVTAEASLMVFNDLLLTITSENIPRWTGRSAFLIPAEVLALICLAADAVNAEALYSHRSHIIISSIDRLVPSRCHSFLWKFRSTNAGFLYHLILAYEDCLTLCYRDRASLLPPSHGGHIVPLDNETYSRCIEDVLASIEAVTDAADSIAKILRELEAIFISELHSAGGLASSVFHTIFPGFTALIHDLPALFAKLIEELQETAKCFIMFGRRLLEFHRGVHDFGWATPPMLRHLEGLLRQLKFCQKSSQTDSFYVDGVVENRSTKWMKTLPSPPPRFVPRHLRDQDIAPPPTRTFLYRHTRIIMQSSSRAR